MILQKLQQAREIIKSSKLKKAGHNQFSGYDYFTPEQINALVHEAEKQTGLIHTFDLRREPEIGIHGYLLITEIETGETVKFTQATEIPQIKATNIAQQIGGAVTYTLRYMLMTAFDISDNSLDFDAKDNREEKPAAKPIEKTIRPITDDEFARFASKLRESKDKLSAGNLLAKTRRMLTFDDAQESIIAEITDNI